MSAVAVDMAPVVQVGSASKQQLELGGADVQEGSVTTEYTKAEYKELLRKIDRTLMPIMCAVYAIQFVDKTSLSYASVMGLRTDTHLKGNQYSLLGTIFYIAYLVFEYPTNVAMQKLPLARYLAVNIVIWGVVLMTTAACKNWTGLMINRWFLGMFESTVTPGFVLITSQWYRKEEQALRIGVWFSFNGVAIMVGSGIAYGIASHVGLDPTAALKGWQILFVLFGGLTVLLGIAFFFLLPDNPMTARMLTAPERLMAVERLRSNQQAVENKNIKWYQVKEALRDVNTWLYILFSFAANVPNGFITNFGSILITSFGYTNRQALILGMPTGAVEVVGILGFAYMAHKTGQRLYTAALCILVSIVGLIIVACTNGVAGLCGYYLVWVYPCTTVIILSLISSNTAGYTKKTTTNALNLIAYCVGNAVGPNVFKPSDAPGYFPAKVVMVVCFFICFLVFLLIRFLNVRENARRDRLAAAAAESGEKEHFADNRDAAELDLTDRENLSFRYCL
ncbi:major facilitator superfamily domain-containing protein [Protomyces lactucae-debilis]|uniref:Major facilitator superfamily domain-containing protein n=1 Tax=Protomyces lactucae-debilis TaxID=2754530 RepID=A0A1Y2FP09_PROLT|nr:major facilitator superfamily domain-containing protein [Protomyces lactucae-debilis]ORY85703.1 major facilitator superfamily domain-containing protein [Protomyces lactucae-debilis]